MNDQSKAASVAEIYATLKQLIDAYESVMNTFGSVVGDVIDMQADIRAVELFVNEQLADAITGRNMWRANARIHEERANELQAQLEIWADSGHRIEIPVRVKRNE